MKRKLLIFAVLLLSCISLLKAQTQYRSPGTGVTVDLSSATNWQTFNGSTWVAATAAPTAQVSGSTILIQATDVWANTATATVPTGVVLTNNSSAALGTFTAAKLTLTGTLIYAGTAAQTMPASASFVGSTITNLTINNATTVTTNGTLTVLGVINLMAGQFNGNGSGGSLYVKGSIAANGGIINAAGNIFMQGTAAQTLVGTEFLSGQINQLNTSATALSTTGALKISNALRLITGTFTLGGPLTISGATMTITTGGIINTQDNMVLMTGTAVQAIPAAFFSSNNVNNLTISNATGVTSAGSLNIGASYTVTGLKAGVTPLAVTGTATVGGALAISSFAATPTSGQQYTILSGTAVSGTFSSVSMPSGYVGTLAYSATDVKVTVTPSNNADLSSLVLSTGALSPAFDTGTISYSVSVPYTNTSISVTPTLSDASATMKVNGTTLANGATSQALPLNVGTNTINIVIKAFDGTQKTYAITVTRGAAIYYSQATGDLSLLSTYGTATDGTGDAPTDFNGSGANATYQLANRSIYTLTSNLTIGTSVNIPTSATLDIAGNILTIGSLSGAGTLSGSNTSSLIVTGTTNLVFASGKQQLNNLSLGAGANVTLNSALDIAGTGTVTLDANAILATGGLLTLKSDATGTATLATLGTGASISGNVTAERYIADKRAWRLITPAVNSTQTISATWQEGAGGTMADPSPGFGTFVIGSSTANGFDIAGSSGSLLTYNGAAFSSVANTNVIQVSSSPAYFLFSIGNRSVNPATAGVHSATVLRAKGALNTGTQTATVNAAGFTLIGNPYAAPLDFAQISRSATIPNQFYAWDINLGTYGGYVLVSSSGGAYTSVPASPSGLNNIIPSGGAIFVQSDGSVTGSLTINESSKAGAAGSGAFSNFSVAANDQHNLRINLADANSSLIDGVMESFGEGNSNKVDAGDALKMFNFYENISISRSGKQLTLERRSDIVNKDTIYIQLSGVKATTYQLQINPAEFNQPATVAYLQDAFLHTSTKLDMSQTSNVSFTTTADSASYKNRFEITLAPVVSPTKISHASASVVAYPNPATQKQINLSFDGLPAATYNITVINTFGQIMQKNNMVYNGSTTSKLLSTDYTTGVYTVNIQSAGYNQSIKVIIP